MSQPTCYWHDGSIDPKGIPCTTSTTYSACCDSGDNCMSNGLCNNQGTDLTSIYRNSCSDQTWGSDNCPQYCVGGKISGGFGDNNLSGYNSLDECSNNPGHYYCTGANADTTCSGGGIYNFVGITEGGPPGQAVISPVPVTVTYTATNVVVSSATLSQRPVTQTEQVTLVVTSIQSPVATIPTTTPVAAVSSDQAAASRVQGNASSSAASTATPVIKKSSNAAAIGGGVGGGLGALLLIGLLAFFLIRRRNKKKKAASDERYDGGPNTASYTPAPAMQSQATPYPYAAAAAPVMQSSKSAMSSPSELKEDTTPAHTSRAMSPDVTGGTSNSWSRSSMGQQSWSAAPVPAAVPSNSYSVHHEMPGEQPAFMNMSAANEMYAGLPPAELSAGQDTFRS